MLYLLSFVGALFVSTLSAPVPAEDDFILLPGFYKEETHEEKFIRSDRNQNKELTFDEFLNMELAYVMAKREQFDSLDINKDDVISQDEYEEHYHGINSKSAALRAEYFGKVFEEYDEDFDLKLSQEEMVQVLAKRFLVQPRQNFPKLFWQFDKDHNGGLDINEYMKFDAEFPFEETDPIKITAQKREKLPGDKITNPADVPSNDDPMPSDDIDMDAVAAVMAQGGVRRTSRVA